MSILVHDGSTVDYNKPGVHHYEVAFHLDGSWGYSVIPMTVINGLRGSNPNGLICIGGTHGNEYEGQVATKRLASELDPEQMTGRVILIPQLSASACIANTRTSPLDGVNMNRAFPGNPRGTISYRIAHFLKTVIFPLGRIVVDIHSGGNEGSFPMCASFHPIPDPAQRAEIANACRLFDTPFAFIYASTMASGLLTDEAEAEGKVAIGGEFGSGGSTNRLGVRHAYEGVRNVLKHYGQLEGEITSVRGPDAPPIKLVRADRLESYVPSPRDGVWEPLVTPGDYVREGDLVGTLHDFSDHTSPGIEIRTNRAGYVLMLHLSARPLKGQTLFVIAEEVPWREAIG